MTEMPGDGPGSGKDEEFRGKWPLPDGARPAGSGGRPEEPSDPSFPASDPPSNTPPETAAAKTP
jgi:hypothetical protein